MRPSILRRFAISVATLILAPAALLAQTGTVEGTVVDALTRAPVVGAAVSLRDEADSSAPAIGDLTDAKGVFRIERVPLGRRFALEANMIGYSPSRRAGIVVDPARTTYEAGTVELAQSSIGMEGVKVTAARPDVAVLADKTVYAVENNPSYTATNVSELLGQIPSIDVDQDGKVSLRGDDNVTIMMNDRPLAMPVEQRNKFLQSLPATMVRDIEVRTTPGAEFDANNRAGIINIVTRRTMGDMLGGNVNAGIDSRVGGNGGGGLYFNGETLNASLSGGVNRGRNTSTSTSHRWNYRDSVERRNDGLGNSESQSRSYYGYGQVDYRFTAKDLFSLSFNLNDWSSDYTSVSSNTFYDAGDAIVLRSSDTSSPIGDAAGNTGGYGNASFLLRHTFEGDHKLSLDVSYNAYAYEGTSRYASTYRRAGGEIDSLRSTARASLYDRTSQTIITKLDYNDPLSDLLTLSIGAKNEINLLDNLSEVRVRDRASGELVLDTLQSSNYRPENTIYAAYANASWRPVTTLGVQAGVRLEHATVSAAYADGRPIVTRDYTNVFPSGTLTWNVTEQHSLALSYRRSVALPDIDALNPTRVRWSDLYEQSGNPDLEPEMTSTYELRYNTFWGMGNMISVAPYYATTDGNIETSQRLVNGVTYSSSANFEGTWTLGSDASVALRPWPWLQLRAGGSVYRLVNRGSDIAGDRYSAAVGYNSNVSLSADLLEGMTFSINGYSGDPASVGGSSQSGYAYWSASLRQRLLDKKLTISLRVNDPFDLQKWESIYESEDFRTEMLNKWSSRFVGLTVSYTFGTQPRMEQHQVDKTQTKGSGGSGGGGGGGTGGGQ